MSLSSSIAKSAPVRLFSRVPPLARTASIVLLLTLLWPILDPFQIHARLDRMVESAFLSMRSAPKPDDRIVQVEIDDLADKWIEYPAPRHYYGQVANALTLAGAKAIMVDVVMPTPQGRIAKDAKPEDLTIEQIESDPELMRAYSTDGQLAESIRFTNNVTLAFNIEQERLSPSADPALEEQIMGLLVQNVRMSEAALSERLKRPVEDIVAVYDLALERAVESKLNKLLDQNDQMDLPTAIGELQGNEPFADNILLVIERNYDSVIARRIARRAHSLELTNRSFANHPEPGIIAPPNAVLANSARHLGFANATLDSIDHRLWKLPLVWTLDGRTYLHQALWASADVTVGSVKKLEWSDGNRLVVTGDNGGLHLPIDADGRMLINWPINHMSPWHETFPRISFWHVLQVARFQSDWEFNTQEYWRLCQLWDQLGHQGDLELAEKMEQFAQAASARRDELHSEMQSLIEQQILASDRFKRFGAMTPDEVGALTDPTERNMAQVAQVISEYATVLPDLQAAAERELQRLREKVDGKLCLIGDTTTGSVDRWDTPVEPAVPGLSIIASAIHSMVTQQHLSRVPMSLILLVSVTVGIGLAWLSSRMEVLVAAWTSVGFIFLFIFLGYGLAASDVLWSPVNNVASATLMYTGVTTHRWLAERMRRQKVEKIFGEYTSPAIVTRLLDQTLDDVIQPKKREISVLYSAINNYEDLVADLGTERMGDLATGYFNQLAEVIREREGQIDKYQGHSILAYFGAPFPQPDHAERACEMALRGRSILRDLLAEWDDPDMPRIQVFTGIHTGELLVGNLSLLNRAEYTVAGENLNVAYRLGEVNEMYDTDCVLSHSCFRHVEKAMAVRELDNVRIKGKARPMAVYELLERNEQVDEEIMERSRQFTSALTAFKEKQFSEAQKLFERLLNEWPNDGATSVYLDKCERQMRRTRRMAARQQAEEKVDVTAATIMEPGTGSEDGKGAAIDAPPARPVTESTRADATEVEETEQSELTERETVIEDADEPAPQSEHTDAELSEEAPTYVESATQIDDDESEGKEIS